MRRLLPSLMLLAACGSPAAPSTADAGADLAAPVPYDITGTFASDVTLRWHAGSTTGSEDLLGVWVALEQDGDGVHAVDTSWSPCRLAVPGLGDVPFNALASYALKSKPGTLTDGSDGGHLVLPSVALVIGAQLAAPDTDPLPDGSVLCSDTVTTGCAVADERTGNPGAVVVTHGLTPDADHVYVATRIVLALDGSATPDGKLDGTVTAASFATRILACHLRGAGDCTASDVAALQAALPTVVFDGGTLRSHAQGFYFTCPQFLADPTDSLAGAEAPPDGGVPADMAGLGGASFSTRIQADVDYMGCATRGCHDTRTAPGEMHLYYAPLTSDELRANYEAVLPFTTGAQPGGRFVNEVPLPADMRARWLGWVAAGTPY